MKIYVGWWLGGEHVKLSPGRAEVADVPRLERLQAPGGVVVMLLCVGFFFVFCILFLCLCVLLFSCPPCWPCCRSPPPPHSILAPSHLAHPSCPTQAVPPLLPCLCNPPLPPPLPLCSPGNSRASMLWRQQVSERAARLRAVGSGLGNNMHLMVGRSGGSLRAAF